MTRGTVSVLPNSRAPTEKPPFTVGSLRKAIPKHCFERSAARSFAYVAADLTMAAALFAFSQVIDAKAPIWLACIAWPLYWFFQVCHFDLQPSCLPGRILVDSAKQLVMNFATLLYPFNEHDGTAH